MGDSPQSSNIMTHEGISLVYKSSINIAKNGKNKNLSLYDFAEFLRIRNMLLALLSIENKGRTPNNRIAVPKICFDRASYRAMHIGGGCQSPQCRQWSSAAAARRSTPFLEHGWPLPDKMAEFSASPVNSVSPSAALVLIDQLFTTTFCPRSISPN